MSIVPGRHSPLPARRRRSLSLNSSDATIQALGGNGAKLSSKWTPVYNMGMVYHIDQKWSVSGSISYLPVKTDATFYGTSTLGGPIGTTTGSVKLNTTDYVIRVGYKF